MKELTEAARLAAEKRAEWTMMIATGFATVADLITEASTDEGKALKKLKLLQVLSAQEGWSIQRATKALTRLTEKVPTRIAVDRLTVRWILDPRSDGRRLRALIDVSTDRAMSDGHTVWTEGIP